MVRMLWKVICIATMCAVCLLLHGHNRRAEECRRFGHVSTMDVDRMSPVNLTRYLYWYNAGACRVTNDLGGVYTRMKEYVGFFDGQKKMCMDPPLAPRVNNCLVYSFGINHEWSFDEAVEQLSCQVYAFDPTMDEEDHDHSHNIHFYNLGVGVEDVDDDPVSRWKVRTLKSVYEMLQPKHGPVVIDYLKMDVEMSEWKVIPHMIRTGMLDKVKQLAIEVHFHVGKQHLEHVRRCVKMIRALEEHGMVRFGSRANYYSVSYVMGKMRHAIYELVWYNKKFSS